MKDILIAALLAVVMALNFLDVLYDLKMGAAVQHILGETAIVLASAMGFVYLLWERQRRIRQMKALSQTLSEADQQLKNITEDMRNARKRYGETIHQQFNDWSLTHSEQQVAMLMLKGLSLKEIATVRDTKEKTVRQQASGIYGKSGLDGRHALSAWFLEDFLASDAA